MLISLDKEMYKDNIQYTVQWLGFRFQAYGPNSRLRSIPVPATATVSTCGCDLRARS